MNIIEEICREAQHLPEPLAREALDFINFIKTRYETKDMQMDYLKQAQSTVMDHVWNNKEDEVWDAL